MPPSPSTLPLLPVLTVANFRGSRGPTDSRGLRVLSIFTVLLGLQLSGCSSLPGSEKQPEPAPVLRLEVVAPTALAKLLNDGLDLGRVNRLAQGTPLQAGELDRLITAVPQQARELLDTEGYFNAVVTIERDASAASGPTSGPTSSPTSAPSSAPADASTATDANAISNAAVPGDIPTVRVTVQPGPRTKINSVDLTLNGALKTSAAADSPDGVHARQAAAALRRDWPLPPGAPFRDADWSRAKTASIAGLRAQGWVQADWVDSQARIDAATQLGDLFATADSGPLFRIGPLRVVGLKVQDEFTVRNIGNLKAGAPATEAALLDFQERLQKSDLFDRATVALDIEPPQPDATPVVVRLRERKLQEATVGIGVGANVGARGTLDHVHRRPFNRPWIARNSLELSQVQQRWTGELSTQTLPRLYRNLLGGGAERVVSDTDEVNAFRLRVGRAQDTQRIDRLLFVEWDRSATTSALGRQRADSLTLHYHGVWRTLDDLVLPTRGRAWTGQVGVGQARSQPGGNAPFTRLYARLDAFHPLGSTWYGQGRVEVGQVFIRGAVQVPEALRFRAGGDESVRGYEYRSLTRVDNGVQVGSEVLFTASAEVARPLLQRLPQLWGAIFVDVGRADASWGALKPAVGYGVGLRYRSPVGPVKLDLAYGEEVKKVRLHLTVGVAF